MIVINRMNNNRVFDSDITKYISDISKHLFQRLTLLNIDTQFNDEILNTDDYNINIYNETDYEESNCINCREAKKINEEKGYHYSIYENQDGNLKSISYNFDDLSKLSDNWLDLAEDIITEIKNNLGYDNSRQIDNTTYKVKKGDSLYRIAKKFNTTVQGIKRLNNLKSDDLHIGQILMIPNNENEIHSPVYAVEYIVEEGDDLYSIADRFNTTVDRIRQLNKLKSTDLYPGQKIMLDPHNNTDNNDAFIHNVRVGDTLESIAKEYNTTVQKLKEINNLTSEVLEVGQVILIRQPNDTSKDNYIKYTVVSGDSLYRIAKKFNITVDELKILNNLDSNMLKIGQELIVGQQTNQANNDSGITEEYEMYTVLPEDNLFSIANKKGVTVKQIKELNNLSSNKLNIGQRLKIPK